MIKVYYLSKFVKHKPLQLSDTSKIMGEKFKHSWHDVGFGIPDVIISDRDTKLTSAVWDDLCQSLNISRNLATARHQQTNG